MNGFIMMTKMREKTYYRIQKYLVPESSSSDLSYKYLFGNKEVPESWKRNKIVKTFYLYDQQNPFLFQICSYYEKLDTRFESYPDVQHLVYTFSISYEHTHIKYGEYSSWV